MFHAASPVLHAQKDPENEILKPAVEGTLTVLRACKKAGSVKRVVVTSSTAVFSPVFVCTCIVACIYIGVYVCGFVK